MTQWPAWCCWVQTFKVRWVCFFLFQAQQQPAAILMLALRCPKLELLWHDRCLFGQGERATIKPGPGHYKLPNLADRRGGLCDCRVFKVWMRNSAWTLLSFIICIHNYTYHIVIYHIYIYTYYLDISIDPDWKLQDASNLLHELVWQGVKKKIGPYENSWNYTVGNIQ